MSNGTQDLDPGLNADGTPKETRPDFLLDQYKTVEDQAKALPEAVKRMSRAVDSEKRLADEAERSKVTFSGIVNKRDTELEDLKRQLSSRPPVEQANVGAFTEADYATVSNTLGFTEPSQGRALVNLIENLQRSKANQQSLEEEHVSNDRARRHQYSEAKDHYGAEYLDKVASDFVDVIGENPWMEEKCVENPRMIKSAIQMAGARYSERHAALDEEDKIRKEEAQKAGAAAPGGGGVGGETDIKPEMELEEMERRLGFAKEGAETG